MIVRKWYFFVPLLFIIACNNSEKLQEQIDSLQAQSINAYKPGLGEFMLNIQIHHAKLWFAGKNKNWKLAEFELNEITETLEAIQKYEKERKEIQSLPVVHPAMDSVKSAISQQNLNLFLRNFTFLTNTCNACHQSVKFDFNVVQIPSSPPFTNQNFSGRLK